MKLLYLLQSFPYPPTDGFSWKVFNVIRRTATKHECHVLAFERHGMHPTAVGEFSRDHPAVRIVDVVPLPSSYAVAYFRARHIVRGTPLSLARWESRLFQKALRSAMSAAKYDGVHCDMINMAQYVEELGGVRALLSPNDAPSRTYESYAAAATSFWKRARYKYSARRLAEYEKRVFGKFAAVHVVSGVESDYIRKNHPNIEVVTIGLSPDPVFLRIPIESNGQKPLRIFTSVSFALPGAAEALLVFVNGCFSKLRARFPELLLHVVGRGLSRALAHQLNSCPGVTYEHWVSDYVGALALTDLALFLDPCGSGIKTRVIQALAAGKPVIGTRFALEGVDITHGVDGCVFNKISELEQILSQLLGSSADRLRMGTSARHLVNSKYSPEVIGNAWDELYERLFGRS